MTGDTEIDWDRARMYWGELLMVYSIRSGSDLNFRSFMVSGDGVGRFKLVVAVDIVSAGNSSSELSCLRATSHCDST